MLALVFRFPAGRYHATPWGRHVNEADVAWPPEPWRVVRALIASYWRKTDRNRWSEADLERLVHHLASSPPIYRLPVGPVHAHTRHYMPTPPKTTTLVFDAFAHLPKGEPIVVAWPSVNLDRDLLAFVSDLADGVGYLGRAESWTECEATEDWDVAEANCEPVFDRLAIDSELVSVITPISPEEYDAQRKRLIDELEAEVGDDFGKKHSKGYLVAFEKAKKKRFGPALPERLLDALSLDSTDYKKFGWSTPPASRMVPYRRVSLSPVGIRGSRSASQTPRVGSSPTVARFLLAGRPRPRIQDAIRVGETLRLAVLAKFGWDQSPNTGRKIPRAPGQVSGRDELGMPSKDPTHSHAFWIPEDADFDGEIDHLIVYARDGMDESVQRALDRLTRLWIPERPRRSGSSDEGGDRLEGRKEWRLALEGFGEPEDFASTSPVLGCSTTWCSVTPFLASGHLKRGGYPSEVQRLMRLRGEPLAQMAESVTVKEEQSLRVGGTIQHATHFTRSRSRGGERKNDARGAMLRLTFPHQVQGPLALGYACHFGLGLFRVDDTQR